MTANNGTNSNYLGNNSDVKKQNHHFGNSASNRWYEDNTITQKTESHNSQFINAYHHPTNNGPTNHGVEIAHSSSSPMSSISDDSSSASPAACTP